MTTSLRPVQQSNACHCHPTCGYECGSSQFELHGGVLQSYVIVSSPPFALFQAGGEWPGGPALRGSSSSAGAESDATDTSIRSGAGFQKVWWLGGVVAENSHSPVLASVQRCPCRRQLLPAPIRPGFCGERVRWLPPIRRRLVRQSLGIRPDYSRRPGRMQEGEDFSFPDSTRKSVTS